jgi:hypothetical protein
MRDYKYLNAFDRRVPRKTRLSRLGEWKSPSEDEIIEFIFPESGL